METTTRIRYCACSKPFRDKLIELGFEERGSDPESFRTKQVRRFYKGTLTVEDSYQGLFLYKTEKVKGLKGSTKVDTKRLKFSGASVDEDLLVHFATKGEETQNLIYK